LNSLPPPLREPVAAAIHAAFVSGFDRILWIAAAISVVGAIFALVLVRQRDLSTQEGAGRSRGELELAAR
jgi:hypothetical protein